MLGRRPATHGCTCAVHMHRSSIRCARQPSLLPAKHKLPHIQTKYYCYYAVQSAHPSQHVLRVASADLFFGSACVAVEADGPAWLAGSLKLGLAAVPFMGDPPSLPDGLLLKNGTDAPSRFHPAFKEVAAAATCTHKLVDKLLVHTAREGNISQV